MFDLYTSVSIVVLFFCVVVLQAEDGIRYLVRSRGLGDVYKRQQWILPKQCFFANVDPGYDLVR